MFSGGSYKTLEEEVEASDPAGYESARTTGFYDNWQAAMGQAILEDLPLISRGITSTTESVRNKQLADYASGGEIPQNILNYYMNDQEGLAKYANETLGLADVPYGADYDKAFKEEYAMYRGQAADIHSRSGTIGKIGQFAGAAHAMALDPLYASTFLTGYGSATTALRAAMITGGLEAGVEVVAQPFIMDWKNTVGADYDMGDAFLNVLFTGAGAGAIGGITKGIANWSTAKAAKQLAKAKGIEYDPVKNSFKYKDGHELASDHIKEDLDFDGRNNQRGPTDGKDPLTSEVKRTPEEIETLHQEKFDKRIGRMKEEFQEVGPKAEAKIAIEKGIKEADEKLVAQQVMRREVEEGRMDIDKLEVGNRAKLKRVLEGDASKSDLDEFKTRYKAEREVALEVATKKRRDDALINQRARTAADQEVIRLETAEREIGSTRADDCKV